MSYRSYRTYTTYKTYLTACTVVGVRIVFDIGTIKKRSPNRNDSGLRFFYGGFMLCGLLVVAVDDFVFGVDGSVAAFA
jgi:hypothetical protein